MLLGGGIRESHSMFSSRKFIFHFTKDSKRCNFIVDYFESIWDQFWSSKQRESIVLPVQAIEDLFVDVMLYAWIIIINTEPYEVRLHYLMSRVICPQDPDYVVLSTPSLPHRRTGIGPFFHHHDHEKGMKLHLYFCGTCWFVKMFTCNLRKEAKVIKNNSTKNILIKLR